MIARSGNALSSRCRASDSSRLPARRSRRPTGCPPGTCGWCGGLRRRGWWRHGGPCLQEPRGGESSPPRRRGLIAPLGGRGVPRRRRRGVRHDEPDGLALASPVVDAPLRREHVDDLQPASAWVGGPGRAHLGRAACSVGRLDANVSPGAGDREARTRCRCAGCSSWRARRPSTRPLPSCRRTRRGARRWRTAGRPGPIEVREGRCVRSSRLHVKCVGQSHRADDPAQDRRDVSELDLLYRRRPSHPQRDRRAVGKP